MSEKWQLKTLDELCHVVRGGSPRPIQNFLTSSPDGINWVKISDATASGKYIYETKEKIRPEGVSRSRLVKPGDFLLSNSMSFGRPYIMRTSGCVHDGWLVLSDRSGEFDQNYLYHFLSSEEAYKQFDQLATGSTVRNLNIDSAKKVRVPLPPLPEQKRIVTILDEAFEGIDTAVANAEKNLANARELFSSYVAAIFENRDDDWIETTVGAQVDLRRGFAFRSPDYTTDLDGIRLLRGDNIVQGELRWDDVRRWPSTARAAYNKYELEENDIVLAMDRTWVKAGIKFARISRDDVPALLVQRVARMRCRKALSSGLLFHLLGSRLFEKYVLEIQTGLGVPHISGEQIQAFRFNMPSVAAQNRTVEKLDAIRAHCESLITTYQDKLALLDALRQSIVQKAFAGELTTRSADTVQEAAE